MVNGSGVYVGPLVAKAIVWSIWIARNDCIFNGNYLHMLCIIMKVDRLLLSWLFSAADITLEKNDDVITSVRRSPEFLGPSVGDIRDTPQSDAGLDASLG